jgi:hypothetical protein
LAHLRTVPDPETEVAWANDHLRNLVDTMTDGIDTAEDIATLREAVKVDLSRILGAALAQAKQVGRQRWDAEIARETKA